MSADTGRPTEQACPACGESAAPGATWCEACGAAITDGDLAGGSGGGGLGPLIGPECVDCGAAHEHIHEGYCGQCGRKQPARRDHLREDLGRVVAVTDRGKRHHQNEDAFAIGVVGERLVAVVCDGVSTTDNPQDASLAAAIAARDGLVHELTAGETDYQAALARAVEVAQAAAAGVPTVVGGHGPASTTFVATIVVPDPDAEVIRTWTAWLGDSRAYWLHRSPDDELAVTQLTVDDSWALDQIALGAMSEEAAFADPRAQSITRWLGADAIGVEPTIQAFEHDVGGKLLSCSDGLWKYVPTEATLAELIAAESEAADNLALAEALVKFANDSGGHDNTTIVIAAPEMRNDDGAQSTYGEANDLPIRRIT